MKFEKGNGSGYKMLAFESALDISLKSFIKLPPNFGFNTLTFKILLFSLLFCGFLTFKHYEVIFASTLIAESNVESYNSWEEFSKSKTNILVWKASALEDYFLNAPSGSILHRIHRDKVLNSPSLSETGLHGSLKKITDENYAVFEDLYIYTMFKEYPCQVAFLKSKSFRSVFTIKRQNIMNL